MGASLKESQKKARLELTHNVLDFLYRGAEPDKMYTRKDLFCTFITNELLTPAHKKESLDSKWQNRVLEHLVKRDLVEKIQTVSGNVVYSIGNTELVRQVLKDWENSGLLIPSLVFPGLFNWDSIIGDTNAQIITEELQVDVSNVDGELPVIIKELAGSFNDGIEITNNTLSKIIDEILRLREATSAVSGVVSEFGIATGLRFGELEKRVGGSNKRLEANNQQISELAGLIRSTLKSMKEAAAAPSSPDPRVEEVLAAIKNAQERIDKLDDQIQTLANQYTELRRDGEMVTDLILRLDAHLDATEALKQLVVSSLTLRTLDKDATQNVERTLRGTKATVSKRVPKTSG